MNERLEAFLAAHQARYEVIAHDAAVTALRMPSVEFRRLVDGPPGDFAPPAALVAAGGVVRRRSARRRGGRTP